MYRTLSSALVEDVQKTFENKENPFVPVDMSIYLKVGEKAVLTARDDMGNTVTCKSDVAAEKPLKKPS